MSIFLSLKRQEVEEHTAAQSRVMKVHIYLVQFSNKKGSIVAKGVQLSVYTCHENFTITLKVFKANTLFKIMWSNIKKYY